MGDFGGILGLDGVFLAFFFLFDFEKMKNSDQKNKKSLDQNHPWESAN